jgi:hypothetical protein
MRLSCNPVKRRHTTPAACFNIQKLTFIPPECINVFHMILRVNSNYFPKHHELLGFCNEDSVFLWGRNWIWNIIWWISIFKRLSVLWHVAVSRKPIGKCIAMEIQFVDTNHRWVFNVSMDTKMKRCRPVETRPLLRNQQRFLQQRISTQ